MTFSAAVVNLTNASLPVCVRLQIIEWLCDNMNTLDSFDQIQEFILGQ